MNGREEAMIQEIEDKDRIIERQEERINALEWEVLRLRDENTVLATSLLLGNDLATERSEEDS